LQEDVVHLADQPEGQGKPAAQALHAMFDGRDIVRDFAHIVDGNLWDLVAFEQQQVRQRRLRALDLR
jgi:hypothetical protein